MPPPEDIVAVKRLPYVTSISETVYKNSKKITDGIIDYDFDMTAKQHDESEKLSELEFDFSIDTNELMI